MRVQTRNICSVAYSAANCHTSNAHFNFSRNERALKARARGVFNYSDRRVTRDVCLMNDRRLYLSTITAV